MKQIWAIVVTYNRIKLLQKCIEAIRLQSRQPDAILVVNNGSTDGTKEWLESQQDLILIHQDNLGGAGGFHYGMKYAVENGADFVWIMDDDVIPTKTALQTLSEAQKKFQEAGYWCSSVRDPEDNFVNTPTILQEKNKSDYPYWQAYLDSGVVLLQSCTFVSVLFSADVIREVGLPYKEYFIWGDDTEYTMRIALTLKRPGLLVGKSQVIHSRSFSSSPSLVTEMNPNRIKLHSYFIRNICHVNSLHLTHAKRANFLLLFRILKGILFQKDNRLLRFKIYFSALLSIFSFSPKLVYPESK